MKYSIISTTVIALALSSQLVFAGEITDTYTAGDTLTATTLDNIKTAVNDNDGKISTNTINTGINTSDIASHETRISNLETFSKNGVLFASPTSCVRGTHGGDLHADTEAINPPSNTFGPSFRESSNLDGTYNWYCDVPIQIPPGATLTLTGATFTYWDSTSSGSTCLIGAQIKTKTFATSSAGTIISEVYSGVDANDYATMSVSNGLPSTKAFPAFSQVVNTDTIVFVNAIIKNTSGTGGDCRYAGVKFDYTVSQ